MQAKLLLIEDTASLAESLARGFGEAGFETRIAHTAAAASRALESDPPDALILDLGLPDLDGLELLAKIRSQGLVIPILVLTARDAVRSQVAALDAGADDYLIKPFAFEELLARARSLLRRASSPKWAPIQLGSLTLKQDEPAAMVGGKSVRCHRASMRCCNFCCGGPVTWSVGATSFGKCLGTNSSQAPTWLRFTSLISEGRSPGQRWKSRRCAGSAIDSGREAAFAGALYVAFRFEEAGKQSEAIDETTALSEQASEQMMVAMLIAAPLALAVAVGGAIMLSRRALAPLEAVIRGARSITASKLSERLALPRRRDELHVLIEEFNRLFARLEQGFAALSRYAADASHELRTPLAVVAAELDVSLLRPRTPEEWERAAQKSLQEIRQLARLVDSLLDLARAEGPLERSVQFDIREPVDQLLARTAEQASANGLILSYAEGSDQPIYVDGDPDALAIAIRNLVDNALRYTPRGGRVRVHLTSEQSQVRLSVEDSGPGVPSKEREAIFTPLARGASKVIDRKPEGYGLGLAIARRIVERHGGSLSVEDAEGGGAKFLIQVPVAAAGREPALPAQT